MKTLIIGFKGIHNPSFKLVNKIDCDKYFLTNSFQGIDRDLGKIDFSLYDNVILFGFNKALKNVVQIEKYAKKDILKESAYDLKDIISNLEMKQIKYQINYEPSNYLCNYAYFKLLYLMNGNAVLIHVPFHIDFLF